tara:strand:+ start:757 stop:1452 length:696 start_codon:yes stop_codon:yes gene_type:complete
MMKNAIILGSDSDIAKGLRPLLFADGWKLYDWSRNSMSLHALPYWDLVIIAVGRVAPVGWWWDQSNDDWEYTVESNLLLPIRLLRTIWDKRKYGASICWLAGSNPNMIMDGYSAYNVSKMAVLKAVEQLDHESQNCKFFALGPGTVLTKIHDASEGWDNPKLDAARREGRSTPIARIYDCMKWAIAQPKEVIGGRNICVSDSWNKEPHDLPAWLARNQNLYKLRREEHREE